MLNSSASLGRVRSNRVHLLFGTSLPCLTKLHEKEPPVSSWIYFIFSAENKAQELQHKLLSLPAASVSCPSHTAGAQGCGAGFQAVRGQSNQAQWEQLSLGFILSSCIVPAVPTAAVLSDFPFINVSLQAPCPYAIVAGKSLPSNHLEFQKTGGQDCSGDSG